MQGLVGSFTAPGMTYRQMVDPSDMAYLCPGRPMISDAVLDLRLRCAAVQQCVISSTGDFSDCRALQQDQQGEGSAGRARIPQDAMAGA